MCCTCGTLCGAIFWRSLRNDDVELGTLKSYDGCANNEHIKVCVGLSVSRLLHIGHVVQNRRSALSLAWHEWFSREGNWRIKDLLLHCRWSWHMNFTSFGRPRQKIASKIVPLVQHDYFSFFIQPVKSMICGVVIAVAVVVFLNSLKGRRQRKRQRRIPWF